MIIRMFMFFLLSQVLVACGGGGGSVDKTGVSSVSSSNSTNSSSSSTSSVVATCTNTEGAVFIDEVCGPWQASFYEQNKTTYAGGENITGEGNNLTLAIVTETDKPTNKVIDIQYGSNNEYNALARLLANSTYPDGVDLSEYSSGSIQFDLKVVNAGADNPPLQLTIECGWPCASTVDIIEPGELNTWKSFEIPVAHLIDRGLDIEKVMMGLQLAPEWNKQNEYHLQIDNVRWVKNNVQQPTDNICYANYLRDQQTATTYIDVALLGTEATFEDLNISSIFPTLSFAPRWNVSNTYSLAVGTSISQETLEPANPNAISNCIDDGLLAFDIYVDEGYTDDYPLSIVIGFAGRNVTPITIPAAVVSNDDLTPGQWNRILIPLAVSQSGLHQVVFNIMGPTTTESLGSIMIDNILIIKPAP